MDKRQTGFVPGIGTGVNVSDVITIMRKTKKKREKMCYIHRFLFSLQLSQQRTLI